MVPPPTTPVLSAARRSDHQNYEKSKSNAPSPSLESDSTEDAYNDSPTEHVTSLIHRDFVSKPLGSFNCLVVQLDAKAEGLLHRCE